MLSVAWSVWVSEGLLGSKDPGPSSAVSGVPHHSGKTFYILLACFQFSVQGILNTVPAKKISGKVLPVSFPPEHA